MPHRLRVCVETLVRLSESSTESNACMIPDGVMVLSSQAAKSSILELLHANMIRTMYCNGSANNQNIFLSHSCTNFLWNVFFKKPV